MFRTIKNGPKPVTEAEVMEKTHMQKQKNYITAKPIGGYHDV